MGADLTFSSSSVWNWSRTSVHIGTSGSGSRIGHRARCPRYTRTACSQCPDKKQARSR